jgi:hypothetical protein
MSNATHGGKGDRDRTDRSKFENNWDKVFGRKEEEEEDEMLLTIPLFDDELEEINTTENFARKMREWNMMYDCLQNIHLYEYPIEEVKELLKQIKVS